MFAAGLLPRRGKETSLKKPIIWPIAIGIGVVDALLLFVFELVGIDLTAWLWNDVLHTDVYRWLVIPVAVVLGLGFTAVIRLVGDRRVVDTDSNLMAELDESPGTLRSIGAILAVGAASLLAGASLGPEAPLMAASMGIGAYAASGLKVDSAKTTLALASVGALLVAFVGSGILMLLPILLVVQGARKRGDSPRSMVRPVLVIVVAGLASLGIIEVLHGLAGKHSGAAVVPQLPSFAVHDLAVALLLGFVTAALAKLLDWLVRAFSAMSQRLDALRFPAKDWVLGAGFALVLGVIYLAGGQSLQFSGSIGVGLLVDDGVAAFGIAQLALLAVGKLVATAWSKGTGYRGGLVFPAIYSGVALGLMTSLILPQWGGAGAILGAIAGILTAVLGSPVLAGIFLVSLVPFHWDLATLGIYAVALSAVLGTLLFERLWRVAVPAQPQE